MSDFYRIRIIIPVHIKNPVCLCKQATGQIDGVMEAFAEHRFVYHHLFGEIPGELLREESLYQKDVF